MLWNIPKTNRKVLRASAWHHPFLDILFKFINSSGSSKITPLSHFLFENLLVSCFLHPLHHFFHSFDLGYALRCAFTPVIIYIFLFTLGLKLCTSSLMLSSGATALNWALRYSSILFSLVGPFDREIAPNLPLMVWLILGLKVFSASYSSWRRCFNCSFLLALDLSVSGCRRILTMSI